MESKQTIRDSVTKYSNGIGISAVFAVYVGLSVLSGTFSGEWFFANFMWLDWIIFFLQPLITAVVGTLIKAFMKREGVKQGFLEPTVQKVHIELLECQANDKEENIPESYETYFVKGSLASFAQSFTFSILLSLLTSMLIINMSAEKVISMIISLAFWVALGLNDYNNMYNYIKTKHIVFMRRQIKNIKELNNGNNN